MDIKNKFYSIISPSLISKLELEVDIFFLGLVLRGLIEPVETDCCSTGASTT